MLSRVASMWERIAGKIEAIRKRVVPASLLPKVLAAWEESRYELFAGRSAWSLFNAFTETLKEISARAQIEGSLRLSQSALSRSAWCSVIHWRPTDGWSVSFLAEAGGSSGISTRALKNEEALMEVDTTPESQKGDPRVKALEPYGYSQALEDALCEFYGSRSIWADSAGRFGQPQHVRSALKASNRRIRQHIRKTVTADARLLETTGSCLNQIERAISRLGESGGMVDMLGHVLRLVALLLGFDWKEGRTNRSVVYFQDRNQQFRDDAKLNRQRTSGDAYEREQTAWGDLVALLHGKGFRIGEIAGIMNCSNQRVADTLVRLGLERRI